MGGEGCYGTQSCTEWNQDGRLRVSGSGLQRLEQRRFLMFWKSASIVNIVLFSEKTVNIAYLMFINVVYTVRCCAFRPRLPRRRRMEAGRIGLIPLASPAAAAAANDRL
jgi:hypothetical protein